MPEFRDSPAGKVNRDRDSAGRRRDACAAFPAGLLTALALAVAVVVGCGPRDRGVEADLGDLFPASPAWSPTAEQNGGGPGWESATAPRPFAFPADHAAHEDYRIEWWYYTGNLEGEDGRRLGYQLTFFRTGLNRQPENPSRWAVRDLYTAHFAVSDIDSRRHYCRQRSSRKGVGQAGADTQKYDVFNGDWRAWLAGDEHRLQAADAEVAVDLTLAAAQPPVLHGEQGLSRKGAAEGNASYYYSLTRMPTRGTVRIGEQVFQVRGDSWMDHEFSTSFLEPGQLGWDWFAVQLEGGVELMLYRMRKDDGSKDPYSSGTLIDEQGLTTHLTASEFRLTPLDSWRSAETGAEYPLRWRIDVPSIDCQLNVVPCFESQEMATRDTTGISYWEGAVEVSGRLGGAPAAGRGYVELTGYGGAGLGSLIK